MEVFDGIASGSRSKSRAARGVPEDDTTEAPEWVTAELEAAQHTTVAAERNEVIDAEPEPSTPSRRRYGPPPITGDAALAEAARIRANMTELPPPLALPVLGKAIAVNSIRRGVPAGLEEIAQLGRTLRRGHDILAFFNHHVCNGPTEAINGRREALRRNALGFRNLTHYRWRSLLHNGALHALVNAL